MVVGIETGGRWTPETRAPHDAACIHLQKGTKRTAELKRKADEALARRERAIEDKVRGQPCEGSCRMVRERNCQCNALPHVRNTGQEVQRIKVFAGGNRPRGGVAVVLANK